MESKAQRTKIFHMKVKEFREKKKIINAVLPLVKDNIWSKEEFETFCENILQGKMYA